MVLNQSMLLDKSRRFGNSKKFSKNNECSDFNCGFRGNGHSNSGYHFSRQSSTKSNNVRSFGGINSISGNGLNEKSERRKKYLFQNENSSWKSNSEPYESGNCRRTWFNTSNYRERSRGTSFGERFQGIMKYDEPEQIFSYSGNRQRTPGLNRGIASRRNRFNQHN